MAARDLPEAVRPRQQPESHHLLYPVFNCQIGGVLRMSFVKEMFCYGEVLLRKHFVWRCFVVERRHLACASPSLIHTVQTYILYIVTYCIIPKYVHIIHTYLRYVTTENDKYVTIYPWLLLTVGLRFSCLTLIDFVWPSFKYFFSLFPQTRQKPDRMFPGNTREFRKIALV
jgi:hypothetical protein